MKNFRAIERKRNIPDFSLLPANWDLAWIEGDPGGSGGGGGGGLLATDDFSSLCNGSLQAFTLSDSPTVSTSLMVYWNGLLQRRGVDFTNSGTSLSTTFVPQTGDTLIVEIF